LVSTLRFKPVWLFVHVTAAFAITDPLGSVTLPPMRPVDCPNTQQIVSRNTEMIRKTLRAVEYIKSLKGRLWL
jgi:hypothetical protein